LGGRAFDALDADESNGVQWVLGGAGESCNVACAATGVIKTQASGQLEDADVWNTCVEAAFDRWDESDGSSGVFDSAKLATLCRAAGLRCGDLSPEESARQPSQACACTQDGMSGDEDTERIGCSDDDLSGISGSGRRTCYVNDPSACGEEKEEDDTSLTTATGSNGAAWRYCDDGDLDTNATEFMTEYKKPWLAAPGIVRGNSRWAKTHPTTGATFGRPTTSPSTSRCAADPSYEEGDTTFTNGRRFCPCEYNSRPVGWHHRFDFEAWEPVISADTFAASPEFQNLVVCGLMHDVEFEWDTVDQPSRGGDDTRNAANIGAGGLGRARLRNRVESYFTPPACNPDWDANSMDNPSFTPERIVEARLYCHVLAALGREPADQIRAIHTQPYPTLDMCAVWRPPTTNKTVFAPGLTLAGLLAHDTRVHAGFDVGTGGPGLTGLPTLPLEPTAPHTAGSMYALAAAAPGFVPAIFATDLLNRWQYGNATSAGPVPTRDAGLFSFYRGVVCSRHLGEPFAGDSFSPPPPIAAACGWECTRGFGDNTAEKLVAYYGEANTWALNNVRDGSHLFALLDIAFEDSVGQDTWGVWVQQLGQLTSTVGMFANFPWDGKNKFPVDKLQLSHVTSIRSMFRGSLIGDVDTSQWSVSNVVDAGWAFYNASKFTFSKTVNSRGWNTSSMTTMEGMFAMSGVSCEASLNSMLPGLQTLNVQNFEFMFYNATELDCALGQWELQTATNMNHMFSGATSFTGLGLQRWEAPVGVQADIGFCPTTLNSCRRAEIETAWVGVGARTKLCSAGGAHNAIERPVVFFTTEAWVDACSGDTLVDFLKENVEHNAPWQKMIDWQESNFAVGEVLDNGDTYDEDTFDCMFAAGDDEHYYPGNSALWGDALVASAAAAGCCAADNTTGAVCSADLCDDDGAMDESSNTNCQWVLDDCPLGQYRDNGGRECIEFTGGEYGTSDDRRHPPAGKHCITLPEDNATEGGVFPLCARSRGEHDIASGGTDPFVDIWRMEEGQKIQIDLAAHLEVSGGDPDNTVGYVTRQPSPEWKRCSAGSAAAPRMPSCVPIEYSSTAGSAAAAASIEYSSTAGSAAAAASETGISYKCLLFSTDIGGEESSDCRYVISVAPKGWKYGGATNPAGASASPSAVFKCPQDHKCIIATTTDNADNAIGRSALNDYAFRANLGSVETTECTASYSNAGFGGCYTAADDDGGCLVPFAGAGASIPANLRRFPRVTSRQPGDEEAPTHCSPLQCYASVGDFAARYSCRQFIGRLSITSKMLDSMSSLEFDDVHFLTSTLIEDRWDFWGGVAIGARLAIVAFQSNYWDIAERIRIVFSDPAEVTTALALYNENAAGTPNRRRINKTPVVSECFAQCLWASSCADEETLARVFSRCVGVEGPASALDSRRFFARDKNQHYALSYFDGRSTEGAWGACSLEEGTGKLASGVRHTQYAYDTERYVVTPGDMYTPILVFNLLSWSVCTANLYSWPFAMFAAEWTIAGQSLVLAAVPCTQVVLTIWPFIIASLTDANAGFVVAVALVVSPVVMWMRMVPILLSFVSNAATCFYNTTSALFDGAAGTPTASRLKQAVAGAVGRVVPGTTGFAGMAKGRQGGGNDAPQPVNVVSWGAASLRRRR